jgi:hypothetical protein
MSDLVSRGEAASFGLLDPRRVAVVDTISPVPAAPDQPTGEPPTAEPGDYNVLDSVAGDSGPTDWREVPADSLGEPVPQAVTGTVDADPVGWHMVPADDGPFPGIGAVKAEWGPR